MKKHYTILSIFLFYFTGAYSQVILIGKVYHSSKQEVWLTDGFGKKIDSAFIDAQTSTFQLKADVSKETLLLIKYEKEFTIRPKEFVGAPGEKIFFSFDFENKKKDQPTYISGSPFTLERNAFYQKNPSL